MTKEGRAHSITRVRVHDTFALWWQRSTFDFTPARGRARACCGAVRCRRVVKAHQDGSVPDKHDVRAIAIVFQRNQPMPVPFGAL